MQAYQIALSVVDECNVSVRPDRFFGSFNLTAGRYRPFGLYPAVTAAEIDDYAVCARRVAWDSYEGTGGASGSLVNRKRPHLIFGALELIQFDTEYRFVERSCSLHVLDVNLKPTYWIVHREFLKLFANATNTAELHRRVVTPYDAQHLLKQPIERSKPDFWCRLNRIKSGQSLNFVS